ncbi:MAG: L,D-transpeptidase [Thermoleophilia bacterium]
MRHLTTRPKSYRAALAAALVTLGALLLPAAAFAVTPEPSPTGEPTPPPTTITCLLSQPAVVYGGTVGVTGVVQPAVEGQEVTVTLAGAPVATAFTDVAGAYAADVVPRGGGDVVAILAAAGTASTPLPLVVKPGVSVARGTPVPFLRLAYTVKVTPARYTGTVVVRLLHRGAVVAVTSTRCRDGKVVFSLPLRGVDGFTARFSLAAAGDLGPRVVENRVQVKWRTLKVGSSSQHVRGLLTALNRLRIRVPAIGTTFTSRCRDSVVAFQKAYGLSRTYVVDYDDWRRLETAKRVRPRYAAPRIHLEVDKHRQILMVVVDGAVLGLIPVSTGATGNTPEGSFSIQRKTPVTSGLYGPDFLYRTMGFIGNFAIHGYDPVPPYPASHGCIREPIWVADWVYDHSFVGERLFIYH